MRMQPTIRGFIATSVIGLAMTVHAAAIPRPAGGGLSPAAVDRIATARVPFIANQGQLPSSEVAFYARMFAGTVFVTADGELVYVLARTRQDGGGETVAFRESFGREGHSQPRGGVPSGIIVNQFKGPDPTVWKSGLPTFDTVEIERLAPGVRLTVKAAGNNVEKLFHLTPGSDVSSVAVAVDGIDGLEVDERGRLVLATPAGGIRFTAPVAYQVDGGRHARVDVAYELRSDRSYGFKVGSYDQTRELVIDPLLASTFLGGHNPQPPGNYDDDIIYGMATTGDEVIVAGATQSPDFPVHLGYDMTLDSAWPDGFIARMSGDLSTIIAATFLGTATSDRITDLAIAADGSVVVVGQAGYGFPVTSGAYTWNGSIPTGGGFVARLSGDLSTLEASAVPTPGGYPSKVGLGNGAIYFGGTTNNPSFPITPGAYASTCCPAGGFGIREYDGFAGRLSADLTILEAMTYLGGDTVSGIAVSDDGSVFLTDGWDSAITGSLARFDPGLTTREAYLSYYPGSTSGSSRTYFNDVAVSGGLVIAAGQTYMNDLPATPGAFDTTCGTDGLCDGIGTLLVPRSDGFVAIYSADLQTTEALTYLGGSDYESIRALTVGAGGDVFVVGETTSVDFPTAGSGVDAECGTDGECDPVSGSPAPDGFIARLSADLSQLEYGSYLGGSIEDRPLVVELDRMGRAYVAGFTDSFDFPTTVGAFDRTYHGGTSDAFISWIDTGAVGSLIFADDFESGGMARWN